MNDAQQETIFKALRVLLIAGGGYLVNEGDISPEQLDGVRGL